MVWVCFLCTFKTGDIQHLKEHTDTSHINFSKQLTAAVRPDQPSTTNEIENDPENAVVYTTIKKLPKDNTAQTEATTPQVSNMTKERIIKQFPIKIRSRQLQNDHMKMSSSLKSDQQRKKASQKRSGKSGFLKKCTVFLSPRPNHCSDKALKFSCVQAIDTVTNVKMEKIDITQNNSSSLRSNLSTFTINEFYELKEPQKSSPVEETQCLSNERIINDVPDKIRTIWPWNKPTTRKLKPEKTLRQNEDLKDPSADAIAAVLKDICNSESAILKMLEETVEIPMELNSSLKLSKNLSVDAANERKIGPSLQHCNKEPPFKLELKREKRYQEILESISDSNAEINNLLKQGKNETPRQCSNIQQKQNILGAHSKRTITDCSFPSLVKRIKQEIHETSREEINNQNNITHSDTEFDIDNPAKSKNNDIRSSNINKISNIDQLPRLSINLENQLVQTTQENQTSPSQDARQYSNVVKSTTSSRSTHLGEHSYFVTQKPEGGLRDDIIIECNTINDSEFRGAITFKEAKFGMFQDIFGYDPSLVHSVTVTNSGCPVVKIKLTIQINIDDLAPLEFFDFLRKYTDNGRSKTDTIHCQIKGITNSAAVPNKTPCEFESRIRWLKVEGCDYSLEHNEIEVFLEQFGKVMTPINEDIHEDSDSEAEPVGNGTYSVKMNLERDIPQYLPMFGKQIRVYYKDIPKICSSCYMPHHTEQCHNERLPWISYVKKFMEMNQDIPSSFYGRWEEIVRKEFPEVED